MAGRDNCATAGDVGLGTITSNVFGGTRHVLASHNLFAEWDETHLTTCVMYGYCRDYCPPDGLCRHCGMDIAIPYGTEIRVAQAGVATINQFPDSWGTYRIWLTTDVGSEVHVYQHLSSFNGQRHYNAGEVLGLSGCANSNHLHFEQRIPDGSCVAGYRQADPTALFERAPIDADWPAGMDAGLARRWYGRRLTPEGRRRFDETAAECVLWKRLGRYPKLFRVDRFGPREYLRYADGTIVWRPNDQAEYRVMGPPGPNAVFPEGMDAALARRWFGRVPAGERTYHFAQSGAVSRLWLAGGRFARLVAVEEEGAARYFIFADGTVIWRPTPGAAPVPLAGAAAGTMPAGLSEERAARWFGSAGGVAYHTHGDSVRRLWLALGRFPALAAVERYADGPTRARTYLRFADGTVIWRPNDAESFRLLG